MNIIPMNLSGGNCKLCLFIAVAFTFHLLSADYQWVGGERWMNCYSLSSLGCLVFMHFFEVFSVDLFREDDCTQILN